jgi:hypothetical protein
MFPHTGTGGYVPGEQLKHGYVPGAKNANRQKCGYVPDHTFVNRVGYDLVVSLTRATSRRSFYWVRIAKSLRNKFQLVSMLRITTGLRTPKTYEHIGNWFRKRI